MVDSLKISGLFVLAFVVCSFADVSMAQDAKKANSSSQGKLTKYGNWTVLCPAEGKKSDAHCIAQLSLIDPKRKVLLVNWRIGFSKEQKLLIDLVTPTEVLVAPGVRLILGKTNALVLPYVSCGIQGCLSRLQLDDAAIATLKNTSEATVAVAATNKKLLQLKLNTTGLAEALQVVTGG